MRINRKFWESALRISENWKKVRIVPEKHIHYLKRDILSKWFYHFLAPKLLISDRVKYIALK